MNKNLTLGSLFDGIGAFPLAATKRRIVPIWASEIETAPISITKRHFPDMIHYGDVTQMNGANIEPVDIVTFGSPCQDLSQAGKREGLKGNRSNLFLEAIRIIDEMRNATNGRYPTYAIWENVYGAFSSGSPKGSDFQTVLEAFAKTEIPMPKSGRWATNGLVRGRRVSIAWRGLDAQYWGVAQRRKRIFLIASFGSKCASEILFEQESKGWNVAENKDPKEDIAQNVASGLNGWRSITNDNEHQEALTPCLQIATCYSILAHDNNSMKSSNPNSGIYETAIAGTLTQNCCNPVCNQGGLAIVECVHPEISGTLCASGAGLNRPAGQGNELDLCVVQKKSHLLCVASTQADAETLEDLSPTLTCLHEQPFIVYAKNIELIVRRLTPLECERLMGFPDLWTKLGYDDNPISDTARYKALGNSIAVPCLDFIMERIVDLHKIDQVEREQNYD